MSRDKYMTKKTIKSMRIGLYKIEYIEFIYARIFGLNIQVYQQINIYEYLYLKNTVIEYLTYDDITFVASDKLLQYISNDKCNTIFYDSDIDDSLFNRGIIYDI